MHANQCSREERTVLTEQKGLVASFAIQKADAEKSIEELSKSIEYRLYLNGESKPTNDIGMHGFATVSHSEVNQGPPHISRTLDHENTVLDIPMQPSLRIDGQGPLPRINETTKSPTSAVAMFSLPQLKSAAGPNTSPTSETKPPPPSALPHLEQHRLLIENILEEVNSSRYAIDHGLRYRLHDGILDLHWNEWSPLRSQHGENALRALLTRSPVLARHWHERLLNENNSKKRKDKESENGLAIDHARPTYIRVHTKYLSFATLEQYGLPWEYDRVSI